MTDTLQDKIRELLASIKNPDGVYYDEDGCVCLDYLDESADVIDDLKAVITDAAQHLAAKDDEIDALRAENKALRDDVGKAFMGGVDSRFVEKEEEIERLREVLEKLLTGVQGIRGIDMTLYIPVEILDAQQALAELKEKRE